MSFWRTRWNPMTLINQLSGKSLRLSILCLLLVLISYMQCMPATIQKSYPIYATLVYSQQRSRKFYFHSCWPSDKSRKEIKKSQACFINVSYNALPTSNSTDLKKIVLVPSLCNVFWNGTENQNNNTVLYTYLKTQSLWGFWQIWKKNHPNLLNAFTVSQLSYQNMNDCVLSHMRKWYFKGLTKLHLTQR